MPQSNDQILPPAEKISVWAIILPVAIFITGLSYVVWDGITDKEDAIDGFKNSGKYVRTEKEIDPETGKLKTWLTFKNQEDRKMTAEMWEQLEIQAQKSGDIFFTFNLPNTEIKDGKLWDVTLDATESELLDNKSMNVRDSNFKKFLKSFESPFSPHAYGDKFVFRIYGGENYKLEDKDVKSDKSADVKPARKKLTVNYVQPKIKGIHYDLKEYYSYEFEPAGCSESLGTDLYQELDCNSLEGIQQIVKDFYEKGKEKYSRGSFFISHLNTVYADRQNDTGKYTAVHYYLVTDGGFQILPKDVEGTKWDYLASEKIPYSFDEKRFMEDSRLINNYKGFLSSPKTPVRWQKNFCQSQDFLTMIGFVHNDNQAYYREAENFFKWLLSSCEFKIITY